MSHYTPYPAYKESGIQWLGRVPEHWQLRKVAWHMQMSIGWTPPTGREDYYGGAHNWVTIADLTAGRIKRTKSTITDAAISAKGAKKAPVGSLLFSYKLSVGEVALLDVPAYTNEAIVAFHPCNSTLMPFWKYASPVILPNNGRENIYGALLLNQELMNETRFYLPSVAEQGQIASALDRETSRIDALIAKKTRFIELLKEKRQAVITRAVTKGLNPSAKMKTSEVSWIGEVPEHWSISKLAYVVTERGGKTPTTSILKFWDGDVPWVSPKDMKADVVSDSIDKITEAAVTEFGMARIPPLSILVVVRGMILAHSFPVAETSREVTINQDMKALAPIPTLRASYLRLLLQSAKHYVVNVLVAEAAHGTRVLRTDIWKQLPIFLPPIDEQDAILLHIANATARLDALRAVTARSIGLLKERRSALIAAAVTGQIDLREAV